MFVYSRISKLLLVFDKNDSNLMNLGFHAIVSFLSSCHIFDLPGWSPLPAHRAIGRCRDARRRNVQPVYVARVHRQWLDNLWTDDDLFLDEYEDGIVIVHSRVVRT